MIATCPKCKQIAPLSPIDSEIYDGQAYQCQSCYTTVKSAQQTLQGAVQ